MSIEQVGTSVLCLASCILPSAWRLASSRSFISETKTAKSMMRRMPPIMRRLLLCLCLLILLPFLCLNSCVRRKKNHTTTPNNLPQSRLVPVSPEQPPHTFVTRIPPSTTTRHAWWLVTSTDSAAFEVRIPSNSQLVKTSQQAAAADNCAYAVNGGPFHADGTPVGLVIVNGSVVHSNHDDENVGFGKSKDGQYWVLGSVQANSNSTAVPKLESFVTGFGWLVRDGRVVVDIVDNNNPTGADRAPRTAVGVNAQGRLLLLVADGCEKCVLDPGPTLTELAETLVTVAGAVHAINLDGGGSSVLVVDANGDDDVWISRPTCLDWRWPVCERPVSTILCVLPSASKKAMSAAAAAATERV